MAKKNVKKTGAVVEATSEQLAQQDVEGQHVDTENISNEQPLEQGEELGEGAGIASTDEQPDETAQVAQEAQGDGTTHEIAEKPTAEVANEQDGQAVEHGEDASTADEQTEVTATEGADTESPATESDSDTAPTKQQQREAHKAAVAENKRKAKEARDKEREQRQAEKAAKKPNYGPRYEAAAQEVGRLRKEFLAALDEKAALLGVERVGEAVPVKNDALTTLDLEIQETKDKLEALQHQRRELKGKSPELDAVNTRIRDLVKLRDRARSEKKSAYLEAMKSFMDAPATEEAEPASE